MKPRGLNKLGKIVSYDPPPAGLHEATITRALGTHRQRRPRSAHRKWRQKSRTLRGTKREAQQALAELCADVWTGTVRPTDVTASITP